MLKFMKLIRHFEDRQKEQDKQANELFKRGQYLQKRSDELDAREKRIAEREEIASVRLFEKGQSIPTRIVSKHPALAAPYGTLEPAYEVPESTRTLLVETLRFYAYEQNYHNNMPLNQGSGNFEGCARAATALAALSKLPRKAPYEPCPKMPEAFDNFAALRAANIARNPEWFPDGAPPVLPASFRGLELAGEVGEGVEAALTHLAMLTASSGRICNILKKLERERLGLNGSRSTKEALAEELGDFIICADLVGMDFDIPLWPSVVSKFNATSNKLGMKTLLPTPEQTGDWSQSTYTPEQTPYWTKPQRQAAEEQTCKTCGGDGVITRPDDVSVCSDCGGCGVAHEPPGVCMTCNGEGKL